MFEWNEPPPQKGWREPSVPGKEPIPPGVLGLGCDDAKIWQCFSSEGRGLSHAHGLYFAHTTLLPSLVLSSLEAAAFPWLGVLPPF